MTHEQALPDILNALLERQGQMQSALQETIKMLERSPWEIWLPVGAQIALVIFGLITLFFIHSENKRSQLLPYIKMLDDELNDIILSLYHLFQNPQWSTGSNEAWEENYKRSYEGFLAGHRYFVRSSIQTDRDAITRTVSNAGRRKMYFNELKKRYVMVYEALLKATQKSASTKPIYNYFEMTEYKEIYDAYKGMADIT